MSDAVNTDLTWIYRELFRQGPAFIELMVERTQSYIDFVDKSREIPAGAIKLLEALLNLSPEEQMSLGSSFLQCVTEIEPPDSRAHQV